MVSFEQVQQKYPAYFLIYEKEGSVEDASKFAEKIKKMANAGTKIEQTVATMEGKKRDERERRENPMIEFESLNAEGDRIKSEDNQLRKRKPFVRLRDHRAQLMKMRVFASKVPSKKESAASLTRKVNLGQLQRKSEKAQAWNKESREVIGELTARNKFMLGKLERKRDEYDVEYDLGKVKKVKTKKAPQKFNFDVQAKKIQKRSASEGSKKRGGYGGMRRGSSTNRGGSNSRGSSRGGSRGRGSARRD